MMFKKRKTSRLAGMSLAEFQREVDRVTMETLQRFLLDSRIAESQQLGTLLGLPPMSEEQSVEEQDASDERAERLAPVAPLICFYSSSLTDAVTEYMRTVTSGMGLNEEAAAVIGELVYRVSLAAALGTVSQLEDLGLIDYTFEGAV